MIQITTLLHIPSNQGWQYGFSACVNFCSRNGLLRLEVEEGAGRHVGLYPTARNWAEQNGWAGSCFLTLPTEMKHYSFLEIWVQRQRHPPTPVRAQCATLFLAKAKYVILASGRGFFHLLYHVPPWVTRSLSELVSCLSKVSWIPKAFETQDVLLRRSPSGAEGQGRSSREGTLPPSVVPC